MGFGREDLNYIKVDVIGEMASNSNSTDPLRIMLTASLVPNAFVIRGFLLGNVTSNENLNDVNKIKRTRL